MTETITLPPDAEQKGIDLARYVCTTPPTAGNIVLASMQFVIYIDQANDQMRLWIVCPWCGLRHAHWKPKRVFPPMGVAGDRGTSLLPGGLGP